MSRVTAAEIYQANLDAVTRLFLAGTLDNIGELIAIPCEVHTSDTSLRIERLEDLRVMLGEQRDSLKRMGTTEYHRICIEAAFTNPAATRIEGRHKTYVMRGGSYLMDPYPCQQSLQREGSLWKARVLRCEMRNKDYTIVGPQLVDHLRQTGRVDPRRGTSDKKGRT